MDFSVIKLRFSRWLSRLFFSTGSRLSRIFRGRLAGLAQIVAGGGAWGLCDCVCLSIVLCMYLHLLHCRQIATATENHLSFWPCIHACMHPSIRAFFAWLTSFQQQIVKSRHTSESAVNFPRGLMSFWRKNTNYKTALTFLAQSSVDDPNYF